MKIGILTFVHTSNYGAVLQAYALQKTFLDQGVECDIIDYNAAFLKNNHDPKYVFKRKGIIKKIVAPLMYYVYLKRIKAFKKFTKEYCSLSIRKYDCNSVKELADEYDRIVVGSDQVWNPDILNGDNTFFLDFINDAEKKCSYAASIGKKYFAEEEKEFYEKFISSFSIISVREKTGKTILEDRLKRKVRCDIDPTLLVRAQVWFPFIKNTFYKKKFIFVYMVPETHDVIKKIRDIAKQQSCEIFWVRKGIKKIYGVHILNTISPEDFLNYIYYSQIVITGSFHATCFSLIYQKKFIYAGSNFEDRMVRLKDLFDSIDIETPNLMDETYNDFDIDFQKVFKQLEDIRTISMNTILNICSKC